MHRGQVIQHMSVFRERAANEDGLPWNKAGHFQAAVKTTQLCRWRLLARHLREKENATMHASGGSGRSSYWSCFAYCYVSSLYRVLLGRCIGCLWQVYIGLT